ncbi:MFS transporter [Jiangella mangrovi]|uniref:MFS family permease n=1 Tax=Jiangella mangrovi TaxID=1524084 RepID=A0A7W9GUW6_9ACTN|nr:MFS transporter [Jiangella mangrovi]MBB5790156.1 MFS family permease [Jiangella mangrovi]
MTLPRTVKVLLAARFVNRLGAFSMPFLAVLLVQDHGASVGVAGLAVGAFGAATIVSRLLGGRLVAVAGSKAAVVIGLCGTAGAQLVVAVAPSLAVALAGAVLLGLCFEIYEPASQGLIADVTPDPLLPAAYGLLAVTLSAAGLVAGLIAAAVGSAGLSWLFAVDAATALACAVLIATAMPSTPRHPRDPSTRARPWTDRRLLALTVTGTAFATVYLAVPMALPFALAAAGREPAEAGLLAALGALVILAGQPVLRRHADPDRRMVCGYLLVAAGLAVAGTFPDLTGYTISAVVIALGECLLLGYASTLVARLAPADAKAAYFSVYGITWGIALTVGPPLMGAALAHGPRTFWLVAAGTMLATAAAHRLLAGARWPARETSSRRPGRWGPAGRRWPAPRGSGSRR